MNQAKFSVGDRVRIGPENGGYHTCAEQGLVPGNTGTVIAVHQCDCGECDGEPVYGIRTDNAADPDNRALGHGEGWNFRPDEIEPEVQQ